MNAKTLRGLETLCAALHAATDTDPAVKDVAWKTFELIRAHREQTAEVERLTAAEKRVRDLHSGFRIYDDCGHQHTQPETDAQDVGSPPDDVQNIPEVGLVCEEGYLYTICRSCCTDGGGEYQTEACASDHDHGGRKCWPCRTHRALDGAP